ncbi:MAG: ankyrin [Desulfobulbus propionicus]|nr:MAG: ankyrin [Desulfobulbus propionicus]
MTKEKRKDVCPTCQGAKIIPGVCEASNEWHDDDGLVCTPDEKCPTCKGTGYVDED